jgi:hypothetical protein
MISFACRFMNVMCVIAYQHHSATETSPDLHHHPSFAAMARYYGTYFGEPATFYTDTALYPDGWTDEKNLQAIAKAGVLGALWMSHGAHTFAERALEVRLLCLLFHLVRVVYLLYILFLSHLSVHSTHECMSTADIHRQR